MREGLRAPGSLFPDSGPEGREGYPDRYVKKDEGEASPVEMVARAAAASCGVDMRSRNICTFRCRPREGHDRHMFI